MSGQSDDRASMEAEEGMAAVGSGGGGVLGSGGSGSAWDASIEATVGLLEVIASEHPDLLELLTHVLSSGPMSFAVRELAANLDMSPDELGRALWRACADLDRLEKYRARWQTPAQVIGPSNLAVLRYVCHARLNRVQTLSRRRRLEMIRKRVEQAYAFARSRAWIESFIGPSPAERETAHE